MMMEVSLDAAACHCLVCGEQSDGVHFGVRSCPACAAFFRRSVVLRKEYVCRSGDLQCPVNKSVRCMCRRCRFEKCLAAGMNAEVVQSNRDPLGHREEPRKRPAETSHIPLPAPQPIAAAGPSFGVLVTEEQAAPLLTSVRNAYRLMNERRRAYRTIRGQGSLPRRIKHAELVSLFEMDKPNIIDFFKSFPINGIDIDQQKLLFAGNIFRHILIDGAYRTQTESTGSDRYVFPGGDYVDLTDLAYTVPLKEGRMMTEEQIISMFSANFHVFHAALITPMRTLCVCDMEVAALMLLSYYARGDAGQTEATALACDRVNEQVLSELTAVYTRAGGMQQFAVRMSKLLLLLAAAQRMSTRISDQAVVGRLFLGINESEDVFKMLLEVPQDLRG